MSLKAILFDVDGTLIDSNDLHARAWADSFRHFGKDLPFELVRSQIGKGGDLLVPDLLGAREMQHFAEELKKYRKELYQKTYMKQVKPFPYARDAVKTLHDAGLTIVLASSADADEVDYYADLIGITELLSAKTAADDANLSKPSPEIFEAALKRSGAKVTEALVVGDTPYDILAAHRASLAVVAVRSGNFPEETLTKAEFVFDDVEELVRRIDEVHAWFRD